MIQDTGKGPAGDSAQSAAKSRVCPRFIEDRRASIAVAAYHNAERRGFAPGHELEDWLAAEQEVDQRLAGEGRSF